MSNERNERIRAFAYVAAEKTAIYRAIMNAFVRSKKRFVPHMRPQEVLDEVRIAGRETADLAEVESALAQLCDWGNLQTNPDTTEVKTVEDFYRQRFVFEITPQGEAAERALDLFRSTSQRNGSLQTNALADIRDLLLDLRRLSKETNPDPGKIHLDLLALRARFDDLNTSAHALMSTLQRRIDLQAAQADQFTSSVQKLVGCVERFLTELMIASDDITEAIRDIDSEGLERLLRPVAEHSITNGVVEAFEDLDEVLNGWRAHWDGLREWFVSRPGRPSTAEILRTRARALIPALLSIITSLNDQRINRIDRSNDLRVLARWFAEARSDAEAHKLWRMVFGLAPARHLLTNEATVDQHETQDVGPDTSWLDASPLQISIRLRTHGSYPRMGRPSRIIDRTMDKEKLAAVSQQEALHILGAQSRFATGRRMRLSEIEELEVGEFDLFLDLLSEAVSANMSSSDAQEILSNDGCLKLRLEPTGDGRAAVLHTSEGLFSGPDHWISVERTSAEEVAP